uniref:Bromodomain-containing protein 8 n=1 Tax=Sparus aurata TaxID=8175 RepID=A0A671TUD0_SPAAU
MANGVGKHKLLVIGPTEPWSVREKLCLATSVMKSGDQNWVSVSRAIKPFAESGRPPDWFSQKHCASKYSELLETTEAPKRKRGEKGEVVETVEDVIVRRLTADRIDELKKLIKDTQEKHRKLKREAELIQAGHLDSKLQELWEEILQKKKLEEEDAELKRKNTDAAYQGISFTFKGCILSLLGKCVVVYVCCLLKKSYYYLKLVAYKSSKGLHIFACTLHYVLMCTNVRMAGAPMLSRLLEVGPSQFSAPLGFMVSADSASSAPLSATTPVPVDATASASTGLSTLSLIQTADRCLFAEMDMMVPSVPPGCQPVSALDKVSDLSEEDVTVSYMGDELDLKTVGDIIAIIEDKADESAEALDAAAVEAALSLCEENGHALSAAWETGPFQPHGCHAAVPAGVPQSLQSSSFQSSLKTEVLEGQGGTSASLSSLCNSEDNCLTAFPMGLRISVGRGQNTSGTRVHNEVNGPEVYAEEEGDGAEGFLSEPEGETELEPAASESEDGYSLHTASSSLQLHTAADSIPSSPASSQFSVCSEDLEALQAHKIWKKAIMLVWRAAANHRYANVFLQPVTDEIAPGYHSIVHRPMDLATIKKNIEMGLIRTTAEFQRDIMLMFQNAVMYNSMDHDVYHMALEMQRDVMEQIQQFLATQLIMETSESGISAKSLRGRESTQSDAGVDLPAIFQSMTLGIRMIFFQGAIGFVCCLNQLTEVM